eukprot:3453067-Pyramimonas_sp.AAC.2
MNQGKKDVNQGPKTQGLGLRAVVVIGTFILLGLIVALSNLELDGLSLNLEAPDVSEVRVARDSVAPLELPTKTDRPIRRSNEVICMNGGPIAFSTARIAPSCQARGHLGFSDISRSRGFLVSVRK